VNEPGSPRPPAVVVPVTRRIPGSRLRASIVVGSFAVALPRGQTATRAIDVIRQM